MNLNEQELATAIAGSLDIKTDMGREIIPVVLANLKLFDRKQQDYGPENISEWGTLGVVVRSSDKVKRLKTLLRKRWANGDDAQVNNESIADSLRDLANYGLIGVMLEQGLWDLSSKQS